MSLLCVQRGLCDGAGEEEKHHCTASSELRGGRQNILTSSPVFHILSLPLSFLSIPCAVLSPYSGTSEKGVDFESQEQDPIEKNQV